MERIFKPCNPNAIDEVKNVLKYLSDISGKGIITGQHTQTRVQKELKYIKDKTGKLPALCGFELLGYSPSINYSNIDDEALTEVNENKGTIDTAMEWAKKYNGLITFTWHWFAPLDNWDKGFFTKNTNFDASQAIIEGTPENIALLSDMDQMAKLLKPFCEKHIPILWRPFHEAEGDWFWWGAKGYEVAKELFRIMYKRYTEIHNLNNLIWVWNSPVKDEYVGDEFCDIISRDLYPPEHQHTDLEKEYIELKSITPMNKITAVGEIGSLPSVSDLAKSRIPWAYYMTWSNEYCASDKYTSDEELYNAYNNDFAITIDKLPKLY